MSSPRVALVTCASLPAWEHDDEPLHAALRARGAIVEQPIWDDPAVVWASFDLVVIRTTWDYQAKPREFVAWAERVGAQTRLLNPAAVIRWNLDKRYLRELARVGVTIAPTTWFEIGTAPIVGPLLAAQGIERGFLKPVIAANSRGTLRFDASDPAQLAAAQAQLDEMTLVEPMMLQPYLATVETEGELSVILFDGKISHAVRKLPVAGDYRVQDDFGAHDEPLAVTPDVAAFVQQTLVGLGAIASHGDWLDLLPLVYARVDMLRKPTGELVLNELELVEPSLFFRHGPDAADRLATALLARRG